MPAAGRPVLLVALPLLAAALALLPPSRPAMAADPERAAAASLLIPGLGQGFNGDWLAAGAHLGLYLVFSNQYFEGIKHPDYIPWGDREDTTTHTLRINRQSAVTDLYGAAAGNISLYSSFAAYRDARQMPENLAGYATPPPTESLGDLALAPFRWKYLSRPTTFLPLLIPLYYALSPATSEQLIFAPDDSISRNELRGIYFITHEMVAVGEEAFFRGFLNNGLSDYLGPGFGLLTSSAIFGVAHTGTGGTADAVSASLFGGYLGFIQQRNEYRISEGVALHFWWNFIVTLAFLRERQEVNVNLFTYVIRF